MGMGDVRANFCRSGLVIVSNAGTATLDVTPGFLPGSPGDVQLDAASGGRFSVPPAQHRALIVNYCPLAWPRAVLARLGLSTNDPDSPQIVISIEAGAID